MNENEKKPAEDAESKTAEKEPKKPSFKVEKSDKGLPEKLIFKADTDKPLTVSLRNIAKFSANSAAIFLILYAIGITVFYILFAAKGEFHADCTDTIMWANASVESGHLYDSDFHYACFLPFGTSLLMQPFVTLFGLTMKAHVIGMMGFFILFTVFFILMLKEMHWKFGYICAGTSILLGMTLSTPKMREIFWGHTIYYSLGILFIIMGMYMYARLRNLGKKRAELAKQGKSAKSAVIHYYITFALLCIFILFTGMDDITGLSVFSLPFLAGIFADSFTDSNIPLFSKKFGRVMARIVIFAVMIAVGMLINNHLTKGIKALYYDAYSEFSAMNTWQDHFHMLPEAWLGLFGVKDMEGTMLFEMDGIFNIIRVFTALLAVVVPIIATVFYPKFRNTKGGKMLRIWVWIHWAVTAVILLGYICGLLSTASWRLVPSVGTSVILSLLFVNWTIANKSPASRISVILMIPMIVSMFMNLNEVGKMPKDNYKNNVLYNLADYLESEGLDYGYATFWNANSITVISDSKVKVRDVTVDDFGVSKRLYQSSDKWYENQKGQKEYFLLLSDNEYNKLAGSFNNLAESASRELTTTQNNRNYHILVFDHNIF